MLRADVLYMHVCVEEAGASKPVDIVRPDPLRLPLHLLVKDCFRNRAARRVLSCCVCVVPHFVIVFADCGKLGSRKSMLSLA